VSLADLPRYGFARPGSLADACALLADRTARAEKTVLLAGGTDFMVEVSQGGLRPDPLPLVVDVSRLPELGGIDWDGKRMRIGAAVSYLELQRHGAVRDHAPLIARMTHDIGGPTIQARGTLGGNLATASPAADGVAAIAAYDPIIEVQSARGTRRIAMADLQTGYKKSSRADDEVIVAVELSPPPRGAPWCWRKVGTRLAQAISKVALAGVAELDGGRATRIGLAMASVAPVTALLPKTRALVAGKPLAELRRADVDAVVAADITPIDDVRSTGEYRLHCAKAAVRAFLRDLGAPL
jgi:xanthine dehydrogenase small subunit